MTPDRFEATFRLRIDRQTAWRRLTENATTAEGEHLWLAGFDSQATIVDADPPGRLHASKDEEPCAGTDIAPSTGYGRADWSAGWGSTTATSS